MAEDTAPMRSRQIQSNAQAFIEKLAALGLAQRQMPQLLGQLERIRGVLGLGKRKVLALLNPQ